MSHDGLRLRTVMRSVAFLMAGALTLPVLTACGSGDDRDSTPAAAQDIALAARTEVADGGTLTWAVDAFPETLNTFQADAGPATGRVAQATLPSMFRLDARGRPAYNPDYLESAKVVSTAPKQVVLYKLNQQAVWSDGREIGADDFLAQWRALSGKDTAYWTARNAGYERIERIERGANNLEVRVTFAKRYADWRSLFSPLYPKDVMGTPDGFNDGARGKLKVSAGPFAVERVDEKGGEITLRRSARWWGRPAKLDEIVLKAVPREKRAAALADGKVDLAEIGPGDARRIGLAARDKGASGPLAHGPGAATSPGQALRSWAIAHGDDEEAAEAEQLARAKTRKAIENYADEQAGLRNFAVRKSLEPAYTQLALNGSTGPLADERVRRAVARALDREELASVVLQPLGLPAEPVGSHLALAGQAAYADNSGALGEQDTAEARALLADAGWVPGGTVKDTKDTKDAKDAKDGGERTEGDAKKPDAAGEGTLRDADGEGVYIVGRDDPKPGDRAPADGTASADAVLAPASSTAALQQLAVKRQAARFATAAEDGGEQAGRQRVGQGGAPGAYAPKGTAAPNTPAPDPTSAAGAASGPLAKDGKPLALRFVLPSGPGSEALRAVGERISRMLERIGIRTETTKVADDSYFRDHVASGGYDLALYSWPATAYPATDARPIYAKPVPAADGSLNVEQNYTRVGTDHIDQLFDQAAGELNEKEARELVRQTDARIWAAAGSIPLYQRPELVAARKNLANAGAFGFETPRYEEIGFTKAVVRKP
ncbi:ABC transporter family substrate-binding protein [Streptomyces sp. NPDC127068]|uniref:ABC transporter family substrate-binding protein n=1 Tax=Streptomyces sp. NPDC127068 TaxID=3347127 RepID=UPI00365F61E8